MHPRFRVSEYGGEGVQPWLYVSKHGTMRVQLPRVTLQIQTTSLMATALAAYVGTL